MIVGFSLSPGGLLLPYHIGALASLTYHGHITPSTPLAGSSAGAIAVTSHATGVPPFKALDASIRVSERCNPLFVARGQLLPSLHSEMDYLLDHDAHETLNEREGIVGLAHRELFPENKPILKTYFETRDCLMDAVCDSSMFPYFTTNQPFRTVKRGGIYCLELLWMGVLQCHLSVLVVLIFHMQL
uniref:PNPLA domain-containing protein n=1 Tax=Helicotheca tamesis TaxID=374047 RepID=A0A7S2DYB3_9STRA